MQVPVSETVNLFLVLSNVVGSPHEKVMVLLEFVIVAKFIHLVYE